MQGTDETLSTIMITASMIIIVWRKPYISESYISMHTIGTWNCPLFPRTGTNLSSGEGDVRD